MGNLKHTVVASLAIAIICSLAAMQAADMTSVKADNQFSKSDFSDLSKAWDSSLTDINIKLASISDTAEENSTVSVVEQIEPAAVSAGTVGYVILSDGALNVRETPSTDCEVIDQLDCGDKVDILENLGDWYFVSYGNEGKTGYVSSASITFSEDDAKAAALKSFLYETGTAVVSEGALNIRAGAGRDFEVVNQLDNGEKVIIISRENEWLKIYYGKNYDIGYVIADSIAVSGTISKDEVSQKKSESVAKSAQSKGVICISDGALNVRDSASENGSVIAQLTNKTPVLILNKDNGWTKIAYGENNTVGYVKSEYIADSSLTSRSSTTRKTTSAATVSSLKTPSFSTPKVSGSSSSLGQALVSQAEKYIGVKYVYGGSSPSGFDCSGLVQYACRQVGISVGRSSRDQFNDGVPVSRDDLQPGDLVFFAKNGSISHVGIYVGNGQMIHAPQTGKTVTYTSIDSDSRIRTYAGARRVTG
ncbi:MAG: SH3 domain-containing protein [Clostridia bacterium]|nr:SH3 domain-containing protein [Clostridia bacterium]